MRNKFISRAWDSYRRLVVPEAAGETQVNETKQAFYAGAVMLYEAIMQASERADESPGEDIRFMQGLENELHEFGEKFDAKYMGKAKH